MDTACYLTCCIKVLNACCTVVGNIKTAVLVVKWLLAYVDTVLAEHSHHGRNTLFNGSFSVDKLYHRSIKPDSLAEICLYTLITSSTLADNRSCSNISGLEGMHKYITVYVNELCSK